MAELLITLADGRTIRHELGPSVETIGRDAGCEIPIDDPSASRRHAKFVKISGGYQIDDLGSKNGTLVNDAPCRSQVLRSGDRVLVGSTTAVFQDLTGSRRSEVIIAENEPTTHATRYVSREKQLLLSRQRLQMIYDLSERLTKLQSRDVLLEGAMDICFESLQFERGAIGVWRKGRRALDWPVVRNLRGAQGELVISRTLLNRALEHGERAIFTDSGAGTTDPSVSMVQQGICSAMCVPLLNQKETLGVVYGDRIRTASSYTNEDIDFLAGIAQQVSIGLINCRLLEEQKETARIHHDIDLARKIQQGLFPTELPNREGLKVAAINDPGQRVSGDYYDVIETPNGHVFLLMADVTGEGVAAAMVMANFQAAVRITIGESDDPAELLSRWNRLIHGNASSSRFITCLLTLIDPKRRTLRFASAGHPPGLLMHERGEEVPEELTSEPGFPLGLFKDSAYETRELDLGKEPAVYFCYTDGVVDAMNKSGETFGKERLVNALVEVTDRNPQSLVRLIRRSITGFVADADPTDDITLLAAKLD